MSSPNSAATHRAAFPTLTRLLQSRPCSVHNSNIANHKQMDKTCQRQRPTDARVSYYLVMWSCQGNPCGICGGQNGTDAVTSPPPFLCDSSVSTAAGLLAARSGIRMPTGPRYFSLPQNVQTGSGAHLASYSVFFLAWGKAVGAWSWPVAYRGGVGVFNPPPKFRRPSKIVPAQPDCENC